MRISDWSSDVCSSDLLHAGINAQAEPAMHLGLATGAPDLIAAAIAELGTEIGGMDTPNSADPDTGMPWRTRFDAKVLPLEEVMLPSAARSEAPGVGKEVVRRCRCR